MTTIDELETVLREALSFQDRHGKWFPKDSYALAALDTLIQRLRGLEEYLDSKCSENDTLMQTVRAYKRELESDQILIDSLHAEVVGLKAERETPGPFMDREKWDW